VGHGTRPSDYHASDAATVLAILGNYGSFATFAAIRLASTLVYSPSKQFFCLPTDRQQ
jgi:hypothetical protein